MQNEIWNERRFFFKIMRNENILKRNDSLFGFEVSNHFALVQWQRIGIVHNFLLNDWIITIITSGFEEKSIQNKYKIWLISS